MAGKELSDFLGAGDYDRFYELYHAMGEAMIARCSLIQTAFDVLLALLAHKPEIFPDAQMLADIQENNALMKEMAPALRKFYLPSHGKDLEQNIIQDMERWKPYDSAAWDEMLAQQAAVVHPFVQSARVQYDKIQARPISSSSEYAERVRQTVQNLGQYLNTLTRWYTTEELEYMLFHPHEYIQGRSPYGDV